MTKIKVFPISEITLDWPLLEAQSSEQGLPLTQPIGKFNLVEELLSFLVCIKNLSTPVLDPIRELRNATLPLHLLHFHFLVTNCPMLWNTNLGRVNKSGNQVFTILNGSLEDFKLFCLTHASEYSNEDLRLVANILILFFDSKNLGGVFSGFKRNRLQDGTFVCS